MKTIRLFLVSVTTILWVQPALADLSALTADCDQCHGPLGISIEEDIPIIAGQPAAYIGATLRTYQQWQRPCIKTRYRDGDLSRPATTMCKISENLTVDEIDSLGAFYESQLFVAAKQSFDPAQAEIGGDLHEIYCETCHVMGGSIAGRGPRLAGQWANYLRTAISQALSGEHLVPPVMEKRLSEFGPNDIDALVNFYSSQQ